MKLKGIKVHPDAAIFPMMSNEELDDLATDIKENGQKYAVAIDDEGQLCDGRNRWEACERAGIKPKTEQLNGQDPKAFILSVNIRRRHMNAGQRAMATAMIYPEPEKGGRGKKAIETIGFSAQRLSHARTVLRLSRPAADAVLAGTTSLDEAYKATQDAIAAQNSIEARLARLREAAPDLADRVAEAKQMASALAGAEVELAERNSADDMAREHARRAALDLDGITSLVAAVMSGVDLGEKNLVNKKSLRKAIDALQSLMEIKL